jgi:hypothetical protein
MMKKYLFYVGFLIALSSCKKEEVVNNPNLEIQAESVNVKAGDEVKFNLSGASDFIYFYSGEVGSDYSFKEGRRKDAEILMSFNSQILDGAQENQLSILTSDNFDGNYNLQNINAADWSDITDKFRIAQHSDNRVYVPSGKIDVSNYVDSEKTVYFAFKYVTKPFTTYGRFNIWRIQSYLLESVTNGNSVTLATHSTAGLNLVLSDNYETGRASLLPTYVNFIANARNNEITTEAYAITKGLKIEKQIDLGPDKPISVKTVEDPDLKFYTYTYSKAGKYKAVFIVKNANVYDEKKVVKELEINVY